MSEQPYRPINLPVYPPEKKKLEDPVAKSIAKPGAFSKPGTLAPGKTSVNQRGAPKGTRFRPLAAKQPPGRPRKRKRDPRHVEFY